MQAWESITASQEAMSSKTDFWAATVPGELEEIQAKRLRRTAHKNLNSFKNSF